MFPPHRLRAARIIRFSRQVGSNEALLHFAYSGVEYDIPTEDVYTDLDTLTVGSIVEELAIDGWWAYDHLPRSNGGGK